MAADPAEHIARAMMMANGDPKWDLSPNDCAAIQHILDRMRTAETALNRLVPIEAAAHRAIHLLTARATVALPPSAMMLAYGLAFDELKSALSESEPRT